MNSRLGAVDVKRTVRSFTDRDCNSGPRALTGSAWLGWSVLVWPLAIAGLIGAQSNPTWAAILFAPTLVASIYGMNFEHMPELKWVSGYPFAIGLMLLLGLVLYAVFKRRGWL